MHQNFALEKPFVIIEFRLDQIQGSRCFDVSCPDNDVGLDQAIGSRRDRRPQRIVQVATAFRRCCKAAHKMGGILLSRPRQQPSPLGNAARQ